MQHRGRVLKILLPIAIIVLVIIALVAYDLSSMRADNSSSSSQSTTAPRQLLVALAQAHWAAIGEKNVSLLMSQYSAGYEAAWFFINGSSVGPTNGRYDCNIPRGSNNCSAFPASAWETLFNHTGSWSYIVCNMTVLQELDGRDSVQAVVWYSLPNDTTIRVPYEMDFQYYNGTWAVWKEFFGLQQEPATVLQGVNVPSSSCTESGQS